MAGYDEEQIRLMDEVCIVLDEDDIPIGSASKKVCECTAGSEGHFDAAQLRLRNANRTTRPLDGEHRPGAAPPRLLRLPLRFPEQIAAAAARDREDHVPGYVDQHLLLAPAGHSGRDGRGA